MTPKLTAEDKRWRAQVDARTLISAETIKGDSARNRAAIGAAKQIVKEKEKEVKAVKKIIKSTVKKRK